MVLNSNQKFPGPKKKEEGIASLFSFSQLPCRGSVGLSLWADRPSNLAPLA
jgi:hypothetical protein